MSAVGYRWGGTGRDHSWSFGSIGVLRQRMLTTGVPVWRLPAAKMVCALPGFHSGVSGNSSNRTAFAQVTCTSYALALPTFWMSYVAPFRWMISHSALRFPKYWSKTSSIEVVRPVSCSSEAAMESWLLAWARAIPSAWCAVALAVAASSRALRASRRPEMNAASAIAAEIRATTKAPAAIRTVHHSDFDRSMRPSLENASDRIGRAP